MYVEVFSPAQETSKEQYDQLGNGRDCFYNNQDNFPHGGVGYQHYSKMKMPLPPQVQRIFANRHSLGCGMQLTLQLDDGIEVTIDTDTLGGSSEFRFFIGEVNYLVLMRWKGKEEDYKMNIFLFARWSDRALPTFELTV